MIDLTNWEDYQMLRLDGEISPAEEAALEAFLVAHPELAGEIAAYEASVLVPEESVVFEGKEALYKPVTQRFYLRPVLWVAAAVLLLMVCIQLAPEKEAVVVKKEISPVPVLTQPPVQKNQFPPAAQNATATVSPVKAAPNKAIAFSSPKKQKALIPVVPTPNQTPAPLDIALLVPQPNRLVKPEIGLPAVPEFIRVPEENNVVMASGTSRIQIRLPILTSLKEAGPLRIPRIEKVRESLRGTETTVMLFDRKLFTINL